MARMRIVSSSNLCLGASAKFSAIQHIRQAKQQPDQTGGIKQHVGSFASNFDCMSWLMAVSVFIVFRSSKGMYRSRSS